MPPATFTKIPLSLEGNQTVDKSTLVHFGRVGKSLFTEKEDSRIEFESSFLLGTRFFAVFVLVLKSSEFFLPLRCLIWIIF